MRRIIILRALYVGDLLCATPFLRALRQRFPSAEITLIGLPWAERFVARLPSLDRLLRSPGFPVLPEVPYDPARTAAFFAEQQREGYDLAIQLQGNGSTTNGLVAALGARMSVGFSIAEDTRITATVPWIEEENEVLRCLRPMTLLGADISDTALEFPITAEEDRRAQSLLGAAGDPSAAGRAGSGRSPAAPTDLGSGSPLIGLHAGARDPRRRWPADRFAELGDAFAEQFGARIVLTGSASEQPLIQTIRRHMRHPALDLTDHTDLGTFAAVIAHLDLLVTNDTGASHLAAATRTPSVVLFGFARPRRWAPLDTTLHTVIDAVALGGPSADPATALRALPLAPVLAACQEKLAHLLTKERPSTVREMEHLCVD